jgi:arylsulfatase A-like enzyme
MRGRRMLAAGVLALLCACSRDGAPGRIFAVVHRLADERAAAAGEAEPPVAAIGYTSRYVFAAPRVVPIWGVRKDEWLVAGPSGEMVYPMRCPAELADQTFALHVVVSGHDLIRQPELAHCGAAGDTLEVRFPAHAGERMLAFALAHVPPSNETVRTAWLDVPDGARLRAGAGLADPRPAGAFPAVRVRASAENERGGRVVVHEQELDDARWRDIDVGLEPAVQTLGHRLRLVFEAEGPPNEPHFAVWSDPVLVAPASTTEPRRRNVVLVSVDTLRADRLGLYGAVRHTSPFLDDLARRSAVFEHVVPPAPHTFPSHASMLTGLYPCAHGLGDGSATLFGRFARPVVPIAEALRHAGYATAAFTEDAFVAPESFQRGFGSFRADKTEEQKNGPPLGNAQETFAGASAWIQAHADEPFFLFVHTYQVHEPYTPPEAFAKLFAPDDGTVDAVAARLERQDLLALYDAEIRMTDGLLADFVAGLERQGLAEQTILVITSDHGQGFGAHGFPGHGHTVFDDTMWVPQLWYAPGLIPPGRHGGGPVSIVDVVPTLYALLGLAPPHELQGHSLAPVLTDGVPLDGARVVFGKGLATAAPSCARGDGWKVIRQEDGRGEFFDLRTDPYEQAPRPGEAAAAGLQLLGEHDRACRVLRARLEHDRPAASAVPDPERERKLRALGYVE